MSIQVNKSIYRVLDQNGDGTGATSQNVNGSVTPVEYYIEPPVGESYFLKRVNIITIDTNFNNANQYGALGAALTNGIRIHVENSLGETLKDFTSQIAIKRSYDWTMLAGVDAVTVGGAGADALRIRWTFERGFDLLQLNGDKGERFIVTIRDNLTSLDDQLMAVQGYKINNKSESNVML